MEYLAAAHSQGAMKRQAGSTSQSSGSLGWQWGDEPQDAPGSMGKVARSKSQNSGIPRSQASCYTAASDSMDGVQLRLTIAMLEKDTLVDQMRKKDNEIKELVEQVVKLAQPKPHLPKLAEQSPVRDPGNQVEYKAYQRTVIRKASELPDSSEKSTKDAPEPDRQLKAQSLDDVEVNDAQTVDASAPAIQKVSKAKASSGAKAMKQKHKLKNKKPAVFEESKAPQKLKPKPEDEKNAPLSSIDQELCHEEVKEAGARKTEADIAAQKSSKFKCEACSQGFNSKKTLEKHRKTPAHKTANKEFLLRKDASRLALEQEREGQKETHDCLICLNTFRTNEELIAHGIARHEGVDFKEVSEEVKERSLDVMRTFFSHFNEPQWKEDETIECGLCDNLSFNCLMDWNLHQITNHVVLQQCKKCTAVLGPQMMEGHGAAGCDNAKMKFLMSTSSIDPNTGKVLMARLLSSKAKKAKRIS